MASGVSRTAPPVPVASDVGRATPPPAASFKDALLAEIRKSKAAFYGMVVAQAQTIEIAGDRVTFSFSPAQRAQRDQFEQQRAWLESVALSIAGRKITMAATLRDAASAESTGGDAVAVPGKAPADKTAADKKSALRAQALADAGVQTMLEVFPAEVRDVEEL